MDDINFGCPIIRGFHETWVDFFSEITTLPRWTWRIGAATGLRAQFLASTGLWAQFDWAYALESSSGMMSATRRYTLSTIFRHVSFAFFNQIDLIFIILGGGWFVRVSGTSVVELELYLQFIEVPLLHCIWHFRWNALLWRLFLRHVWNFIRSDAIWGVIRASQCRKWIRRFLPLILAWFTIWIWEIEWGEGWEIITVQNLIIMITLFFSLRYASNKGGWGACTCWWWCNSTQQVKLRRLSWNGCVHIKEVSNFFFSMCLLFWDCQRSVHSCRMLRED